MSQPLVSIRTSESYRREARAALRGKWKAAVLLGVLLALIGGAIIGPSVNVANSEQLINNNHYTMLTVTLGPLTSQTYWNGTKLVLDAAKRLDMPGLVPLNEDFLSAVGAAALIFALLSPVYTLGMTRLTMRLHAGESLSLSILKISPKEYLRMAGTLLLTLLTILWLPMLFLIGGSALAVLAPDAFAPAIALLITAVIIIIPRSYSYQMAPMLSVLKPELSIRESVSECGRLMKGHRYRLFSLGISFIGWVILLALSTSVLFLPTQFISLPLAALSALEIIAGVIAVPLTVYQQTALFGFLLDRASMSTWEEPKQYVQPAPAPAPSEDDTWTDPTYRPYDQPEKTNSSDKT